MPTERFEARRTLGSGGLAWGENHVVAEGLKLAFVAKDTSACGVGKALMSRPISAISRRQGRG